MKRSNFLILLGFSLIPWRLLFISTSTLLLLASWMPAAEAEGSRDMFPSGAPGERGHIEWRNDFTTGFRRRTLFRVFAQQDEYILMGSSAVGVNRGDVEIFVPGRVLGRVANEIMPATADFSCDGQQPGRGFISSRAQELAGPAAIDGSGNVGGYQPCYYQAPTTGIYYVAIYGPSGKNSRASPNNGVEHSVEAINTRVTQNTGISAWDVTVRSTTESVVDLEGRLHTFNMAFNMGQNRVNLHSELYPITVDGFRYRIELNGVDPYGFNIFGNQLGNLDSDGVTPLYRTVVGNNGNLTTTVGGTSSAAPQYPIFFNKVDDATLPFLQVYSPFTGLQTGMGFPTTALLPQVLSPTFIGNLSGVTSSIRGGGVFSFGSTLLSGNYEIVLSQDGVDYDPSNPRNKVLRGYMPAPGQQNVPWDGLDNGGEPFPSGSFPYSIIARGGEYHFPMSDVENNPLGGPIYNLLNANNPRGNTVGFYDHRGYYTIDGTLVPDRDASDGDPTDDALCGSNPPFPPVADLILGSDSAAPGFNAFGSTTSNGNTNVMCTGAFGDTKTLDLWTYFPSLPPEGTLIVVSPTDFGDAPDTGSGNGVGNYSTRLEDNGPFHSIAPALVYLGVGVSDDEDGFVDGIDDAGNALDDADDAVDLLDVATVPMSGTYGLNNVVVGNDSTETATLHGWVDFDRDGTFEAGEYASDSVAPGEVSADLGWVVPNDAIAGTTYIRLRLTTDGLSDDAVTADVDERSMGPAIDGEVEDYQSEIVAGAGGPKVLLVKRITAIAGRTDSNPNDGTLLNQVIDDVVSPQAAEDNHPYWPTDYLVGAINGGDVRPSSNKAADTVEYTIYFLSVGSATARRVLLCDRIPENTTFLPDAYGGAQSSQLLGLTLQTGPDQQLLTGAADTDRATYFPPGVEPISQFPTVSCDGPNTNGSIVIDLGDLPQATGVGTPTTAYGWLRFQVRTN